MTSQEKLKRFLSPQCPADYSIGFTFSELQSFEEGKKFLDVFLMRYVPFDKWPKEMILLDTVKKDVL